MSDNDTGDRRRADLKASWLDFGEKAEAARDAGEERTARIHLRRQTRIADSFCAENKGLATVVARKFFAGASSKTNHDDYVSAAMLGMFKAFTLWDPAKATFGTFSRPYIEGEVKRAVASVEAEGISYGDFTARHRVRVAEQKLREKRARHGDLSAPTVEEIAEEAEQTTSLVERVRAPRPTSLDTPVGEGDSSLGDLIADSFDATASEEMVLYGGHHPQDPALRAKIARRVEPLPDGVYGPGLPADELTAVELFVYVRRNGIDAAPSQTLNEVGDMIGLGRETVRRHETRANEKAEVLLATAAVLV